MTADPGRIRPRYRDSIPRFEPAPRPGDDAPNVVMIVLDDLGFADLGCYGSDLATPSIDGIAERGLRYNCFHVTALCSPTRAALLTGRNHHAVGMGHVADSSLGFPGYTARIPASAGTLPRYLRDAGYSTFAVGKWHLTPRVEKTPSGPFGRWPLGLGFERYYGFLGAETNQWAPELVRDNGYLDRPSSPGYHLTEDLADEAMRLVRDQQGATPGKPFFLYFAPGAVHAPHHVPESYVAGYEAMFEDGWEARRKRIFERQRELGVVPPDAELTPRPSWVPAWQDLPEAHRRLFARQMQVYAGFLTHTDAQIGRLLAFLADMELVENTMFVLLSDNGASAEGGPVGSLVRYAADELDLILERQGDLGTPRAYNHYSWGWAWASNTPFKLWKRYSWLGGVRVPLVIGWGAGIPPGTGGQVRRQFCHAVDLAPTVLAAAGVGMPDFVDGVAQRPFDGADLGATFASADAPSPRDTQYFEMLGSRAIYHEGWKATTNTVSPWQTERDVMDGSHDLSTDRWSLFDLRVDFSEAHDLADEHPEKTRELSDLWWLEAGRNNVLPLLDVPLALRVAASEPFPYPAPAKVRLAAESGSVPVGSGTLDSGFRLTGELDLVADTSGVVCAQGDWLGGWACYFLAGELVLAFAFGDLTHRFGSTALIEPGRRRLEVSYLPAGEEGAGLVVAAVDGHEVLRGSVQGSLAPGSRYRLSGILAGRDDGLPVTDEYRTPFPLTATIHRLDLEIGSIGNTEPDETIAAMLSSD